MLLGLIKEDTFELSVCRSYINSCLAIYSVAINGRRVPYTFAKEDKLKKSVVNKIGSCAKDW